MLHRKWPAYLVIMFTILAVPKLYAQELHLVTAALPPLAPSADKPGYMAQIAREAFTRIGVQVTISRLPAERALINVNSGLDDGVLMRMAGLKKAYPNLIRIPEKVMTFEFVAFTRNTSIHVSNFAELEPYTVAYVTGWKFYEDKVKKALEITCVRNLPELFELLKKERSEIILAERWQGLWAAKQKGMKVRLLQPPFKVSDMYMYLNKRHAALVPMVAQALADMKQDGSFQRIAAVTLQPLEDQ